MYKKQYLNQLGIIIFNINFDIRKSNSSSENLAKQPHEVMDKFTFVQIDLNIFKPFEH